MHILLSIRICISGNGVRYLCFSIEYIIMKLFEIKLNNESRLTHTRSFVNPSSWLHFLYGKD